MKIGCSPKTLSLFNLVVFVLFIDSCDAWSFFLRKEHIHIKNTLGEGVDLIFQCKSKDDDLGAKRLASQESWEFVFRPNFWGTTLFYCNFSWNGRVESFDIYMYRRDYNRCNDHTCLWEINQSGPCKKTSLYGDLCFDWTKPNFLAEYDWNTQL